MLKDKLTEKEKSDINLLIKHRELEFTWQEIEPILRELIERAEGLPPTEPGPKKPTMFPDILATKPDGSPGTLEELMMEMGYLPVSKPQPPPKPPSIKDMDLKVSIDLKKPLLVPSFVWDKWEVIQKIFSWYLNAYTTVKIIDKRTGEEGISK